MDPVLMLRGTRNFQGDKIRRMTENKEAYHDKRLGWIMKNKKEGLTPRQLDIYNEVVDFISGNKYSPSYEEIKQLANLRSKSEVHRYVHQLERRGWIKLGNGRNRSISIV